MDEKQELPKRKHPRLNVFDYSSNGAYFITMCTHNRRCVFSRIADREFSPSERNILEYTKFGEIAEQQLLLLEERYSCLTVDKYVIMPNHIHAIFVLNTESAETRSHPTLMDIVCAYKSLTVKECKKNGFAEKLFQASFYEHIIRGLDDYNDIVRYIHENPIHWYYDKLYTEK